MNSSNYDTQKCAQKYLIRISFLQFCSWLLLGRKLFLVIDNTVLCKQKYIAYNNNSNNNSDNNNKNKYDINPIQIGQRQLHFIRLNHVLFDLNKLSKDTAFIFTFTPFSSVKLTTSKTF